MGIAHNPNVPSHSGAETSSCVISMNKSHRRETGDTESETVVITPQMVQAYAVLMNDLNPIHVDEATGKQSIFGFNIAHGMLVGGLFGPLIVNKLLGPGVLYRKQTLEFDAPVPVGDAVTATVTVTEAKHKSDKHIYVLKTECFLTETGQRVIQGEAVIIVPANGLRQDG